MDLKFVLILLTSLWQMGHLLQSTFYRGLTFPGQYGVNQIYQQVDYPVQTRIECGAICQQDSLSCNAFFYDKETKSCRLVNILNAFSSSVTQTNHFGYMDFAALANLYLESSQQLLGSAWSRYMFSVVNITVSSSNQLDVCRLDCFLNQNCSIFVAMNNKCYLGSLFLNSNAISSTSTSFVYGKYGVLANLYLQSSQQLPGSNWSSRMFFVADTSGSSLIQFDVCRLNCFLNKNCSIFVALNNKCYLGSPLLISDAISSTTTSFVYGNYDAQWAPWDEWSNASCTKNCGTATRTRTRECNLSYGGRGSCTGPSSDSSSTCKDRFPPCVLPCSALAGNTYSYFDIPTVFDCLEACKIRPQCVSFTFDVLKAICYLKSDFVSLVSNTIAISGHNC